ncbi:MAG TPA: hypothetical protein VEI03_00155 [Stellaceae bacterium]|nr:hypothetical protein [Stellaceae bacterium]
MRRLLPLLLLQVVACQPIPHPFSEAVPPPRSPALSPRDSAGIVVAPITGAPEQVAEALAAALRDAEIPASILGTGNKGSFRLVASARAASPASGRAGIVLDWELRAADGKILGHGSATVEAPAEAWRRGDETVARAIAGNAAPAIARVVQDDPPRTAAITEPLLAVRAVIGAPGDGGPALTRAMDYALRRFHVALAEKAGDKESFVLAGKVALSPAEAGRQQVTVSWALLRPDGGEIGHVDQQNAVPAGSLDGPWGDIAFAVASAAAPGVAALIEKAKAVAEGGAS